MVNTMYYINCLFDYSIFGFIFESVVGIFRKTGFSSGILYGPWTPIYGIGVNIILLLSHYFFQNLYFVWWREVCIVFFAVMVSLTLIEWFGGILIEKVFHVVFWNYEEFEYHIGKYIALEVSFLWRYIISYFNLCCSSFDSVLYFKNTKYYYLCFNSIYDN